MSNRFAIYSLLSVLIILITGCGNPDASGKGYRILGATAPSVIKIKNKGGEEVLLGTVKTETYGGDMGTKAVTLTLSSLMDGKL